MQPYDIEEKKLKATLRNVEKVSITTDCGDLNLKKLSIWLSLAIELILTRSY